MFLVPANIASLNFSP